MNQDEIIEALSQRLSETNISIDKLSDELSDWGPEGLSKSSYLDLIGNLAPNEELLMKIEKEQPPKEPMYFLFGEEACNNYTYEGMSFLMEEIKIGVIGWAVFKYEDFSNPIPLMEAFDGWVEYLIITEEEYNKIQKL